MKQTHVRFAPPLALILSLLLGGCASDSVDPGTTRTPGVGSWYAFSKVRTDSSRAVVPGTLSEDSLAVVSTGNSFRGKSNLHLLESAGRQIYLGYESSGDVMSIADDSCKCWLNWIPYVVGTRQTMTLPTRDTLLSPESDRPVRHRITEVIRHDGTESVTVPAGTFDTHKMTLVRTESATSSIGTGTIETKTTYYFAPSIGYLVKIVSREEGRSTMDPARVTASGSEQVLLGYEIR